MQTGKVLHLQVSICSKPHLWSRALERKNEARDTVGQIEFPPMPKDGWAQL